MIEIGCVCDFLIVNHYLNHGLNRFDFLKITELNLTLCKTEALSYHLLVNFSLHITLNSRLTSSSSHCLYSYDLSISRHQANKISCSLSLQVLAMTLLISVSACTEVALFFLINSCEASTLSPFAVLFVPLHNAKQATLFFSNTSASLSLSFRDVIPS